MISIYFKKFKLQVVLTMWRNLHNLDTVCSYVHLFPATAATQDVPSSKREIGKRAATS